MCVCMCVCACVCVHVSVCVCALNKLYSLHCSTSNMKLFLLFIWQPRNIAICAETVCHSNASEYTQAES